MKRLSLGYHKRVKMVHVSTIYIICTKKPNNLSVCELHIEFPQVKPVSYILCNLPLIEFESNYFVTFQWVKSHVEDFSTQYNS